MHKANGRTHKPKETAKRIIKGKQFQCPECKEITEISNVEFGSKYSCPKCGCRELYEIAR